MHAGRVLLAAGAIALCGPAQSDVRESTPSYRNPDAPIARRVEDLLLRVNREQQITMIVVSHHIPSTVRMADHVVLLLPDRAVEGSPEALLENEDAFVRAFMREEDVANGAALGAHP